ncbi:MAG: hypothetical protein EBY57_08660 [Actinobacteria bacterium]|nr:hypothetical protein [Actinomycetota bacterium]
MRPAEAGLHHAWSLTTIDLTGSFALVAALKTRWRKIRGAEGCPTLPTLPSHADVVLPSPPRHIA